MHIYFFSFYLAFFLFYVRSDKFFGFSSEIILRTSLSGNIFIIVSICVCWHVCLCGHVWKNGSFCSLWLLPPPPPPPSHLGTCNEKPSLTKCPPLEPADGNLDRCQTAGPSKNKFIYPAVPFFLLLFFYFLCLFFYISYSHHLNVSLIIQHFLTEYNKQLEKKKKTEMPSNISSAYCEHLAAIMISICNSQQPSFRSQNTVLSLWFKHVDRNIRPSLRVITSSFLLFSSDKLPLILIHDSHL